MYEAYLQDITWGLNGLEEGFIILFGQDLGNLVCNSMNEREGDKVLGSGKGVSWTRMDDKVKGFIYLCDGIAIREERFCRVGLFVV